MCRDGRKESLKSSERNWIAWYLKVAALFFPFWSLKFTKWYGSSHSCQITSIALEKVAYFIAFTSPGIVCHSLRLGSHQPLCGCQWKQKWVINAQQCVSSAVQGQPEGRWCCPLRFLYKTRLKRGYRVWKYVTLQVFCFVLPESS